MQSASFPAALPLVLCRLGAGSTPRRAVSPQHEPFWGFHGDLRQGENLKNKNKKHGERGTREKAAAGPAEVRTELRAQPAAEVGWRLSLQVAAAEEAAAAALPDTLPSPPPPLGKCLQSLQHLSRQCQAAVKALGCLPNTCRVLVREHEAAVLWPACSAF